MRIVGGKYRGRVLAAPPDASIRPTTDRVREAVFNILLHRYPRPDGTSLLHQARVADLYCGTGALGLEALSRGAAHCHFVDKNVASLGLARQNAALLDCASHCTFTLSDSREVALPAAPFDLVFLDPPYHQGLIAPTVARLLISKALSPTAVIVTETDKEEPLELDGMTLETERVYGKIRVGFWQQRNA